MQNFQKLRTDRRFCKKKKVVSHVYDCKNGQDGHDRGAKVVATGYGGCGF